MTLTPRRLSVAIDPDTSAVRLSALAWHPIPWVALVASQNPSCPRWVRNVAVARRPRLAGDVLKRYDDVPARLLKRCAGSTRFSSDVAAAAVTHVNADTDVWEAALSRPGFDTNVMRALLSNGNLPSDLVTLVSRRLFESFPSEATRDSFYSDSHSILLKVCCHPNVSADVLSEALSCVSDADHSILAAIAGNPNTREEDAVMAALRAHTHRPAVVRNP